MSKSHMRVPGEIVKLHAMAVPSRSKYGFDKLAVGEAVFIPHTAANMTSVRSSVGGASHKSWGAGKKFVFRNDPDNQRYMVYRAA